MQFCVLYEHFFNFYSFIEKNDMIRNKNILNQIG